MDLDDRRTERPGLTDGNLRVEGHVVGQSFGCQHELRGMPFRDREHAVVVAGHRGETQGILGHQEPDQGVRDLLRFGRGAALDLEAHPDPRVTGELDRVFGRRDAQTRELLAEPSARVQLGQLAPGQPAHRPVTIGRSVERRVMHHHELSDRG